MKASEMTDDKNISFLLKGPYGFGKTLAAASFALDGKVYIFYFDKKKPTELKWFKQFGEVGRKILDNIEFDVYSSHNANEFLNKVIKLNERCPYFAVITDSVTNLTAAAVNWSLGFRTGGKKDKDAIDKNTPQLIPDFDEYKVETSLISQSLDLFRTMPTNVIWTAHPLPQLKIEGAGRSMNVTKSNSIVTYGSKVAGMIPGNFTEIYHFSQQSDWSPGSGSAAVKYIVNLRAVGDEFAKTALFDNNTNELDITNKLFYQVWKEKLASQSINKTEGSVSETSEEPKPQTANQFTWGFNK